MADHLTKALSRTLFHRHADYLLGHIPPRYSPVNETILANIDIRDVKIVQYVPTSFTTPATAKASRILTPTQNDITGNPWVNVLWWNEDYNSNLLI